MGYVLLLLSLNVLALVARGQWQVITVKKMKLEFAIISLTVILKQDVVNMKRPWKHQGPALVIVIALTLVLHLVLQVVTHVPAMIIFKLLIQPMGQRMPPVWMLVE
jgi:hypothetical protein